MFPTFLITFREVIEASIIVSLVLGILQKANRPQSIRTVWLAVSSAFILSFLLLFAASLLGIKLHQLYSRYEAYFEGFLMLFSTIFITWTIFYLHNFFSRRQRKLTGQITKTINRLEQRGVFIVVFSSVFREGFEIVVFLSTIYLTSSSQNILFGFLAGIIVGMLVSATVYRLTQKTDLNNAVRLVNLFLVIFAAGLLIRGIREFTEVGLIPEIGNIVLGFVPAEKTIVGSFLQSMFGITNEIDSIQLLCYLVYLLFVQRFILSKKS